VIIQNLEVPSIFYSVTMQPTNAVSPSGEAGAQWDFDGFIYCAYNNGDGVYEILVDDVDVQSLEVPVTLVNPSQELIGISNDGLNCITVEPPFTTTSTTSTTTTVIIEACFNDPFNCTDTGVSYRWPLTSDQQPTEILRLNVGFNNYSIVCNFPDNDGLVLEACGINPVDSTIYCTEASGTFRNLVRVTCPTDGSPGYICFLGTYRNVNAGNFRDNGDYVSARSSGNDLYVFPDVASLPGFTPKNISLDIRNMDNGDLNRRVFGDDLVVVRADIGDGSGETEWTVTCSGTQVVLVGLTIAGNPTYTLNMVGAAPLTSLAPSVWSYQGPTSQLVYCAYQQQNNLNQREVIQVFPEGSNTTTFEIPAVQIMNLNERVRRADDGLNCLNATSPFPVGNSTTTTTIAPCFSDPFDCTTYASVPLQIVSTSSTNSPTCVSTIQGLNVTTGQYEPLCSTSPGECFLACAISPVDGLIYCQTTSLPRYLTRMTCDVPTGILTPCFLGRITTRNRPEFNTAAFRELQNRYVYIRGTNNDLRLGFAPNSGNITALPGFVSRPDPQLPFIPSNRLSNANFFSENMAIE
ncbi:unnamed protein product, partial [Symbiodinium sp. CCMP2456]